MTLEFFMPMDPPTVTHQEKQIRVVRGKPIVYEPADLKAARQKLMAHLAKHAPEVPIAKGVPVELVSTWCYPTDDPARDACLKTTKPDTDNMVKLLKDCMTAVGFWTDDAQVCREITEKFWVMTTPPGIRIRVTEVRSCTGRNTARFA